MFGSVSLSYKQHCHLAESDLLYSDQILKDILHETDTQLYNSYSDQ